MVRRVLAVGAPGWLLALTQNAILLVGCSGLGARSDLPVFQGEAGPDQPGDMDHHTLMLDLAAGSCALTDADEGVIEEIEGSCVVSERKGPWWRVAMKGQRVVERDGKPPKRTAQTLTVEVAPFDDLPPKEQRRWVHDLAEEAELEGGVGRRGLRVYR